MVNLSIVHYAYLIMILAIIIIICLKKDVVLPSIVGIAIVGYLFSYNILKTLQIVFMSVLVSGKQFIEIIIIIALVYAMSKALKEMGVDELIIAPITKLITSINKAFFILGFTMLVFSWFIWPSPAAAFLGAIMIPITNKLGLPPIWAAVSMSLFGSGVALSSDYFIQAAPAITSKTAGISNSFDIIKASFPLWIVMSVTTITVAFIMMKRDLKLNYGNEKAEYIQLKSKNYSATISKKFIALGIPVVFIGDIIFMYIYKIKGTEATALIGGTTIMAITISLVINYGIKPALEKTPFYIKEGFIFSMKVFAPIIIIGAFFFLGSKETSTEIFGVPSNGLLTDIGNYLAYRVSLNKISAILLQTLVSAMLGVGGSGFSGLPLIGTLSQVFSASVDIKKDYVAALGQIVTIWVGGGTIIPWSVIPIAAICEVEPFELVRKNILPVMLGFLIMIITAVIIV